MFIKLKGNNAVKEVFQRLLRSERLPNSLLFTGESGIGKKAFALELAKASVCRNPIQGEACDECPGCVRANKFDIPLVEESTKVDDSLRTKFKTVFSSEHPDVAIVAPLKKNILVDAIRSLEIEANYRPYEAKARFLLIDEAEKMNDAASNALLKTLEEPSPTSHIILITSRPNSLLQTIRSRCQTVRFGPVETSDISAYLTEQKKFTPNDAELLAKLSRGSIGKALKLDLEAFRIQREGLLKAVESLVLSQSLSVVLRMSEEMNDAKNKDSYENYLDVLQTLTHDIWTLTLETDSENIINSDITQQLRRISQKADRTTLAGWLREIETLRANFGVNVNKKIATDGLFMKMAG